MHHQIDFCQFQVVQDGQLRRRLSAPARNSAPGAPQTASADDPETEAAAFRFRVLAAPRHGAGTTRS